MITKRKRTSNLEIGDFVASYARFGRTPTFAQVTGVGKTRLQAMTTPTVEGKKHTPREVVIMRVSGKHVGHDRYWIHLEDVEAARKEQAAAQIKKAKAAKQKEDNRNAQLERTKAANPTFDIQTLPLGIQMTTYVDANGLENVVFFTSKPSERLGSGPGVDLSIAIYGPASWGDNFSSTSRWGKTIEAALYGLISDTFR